MKNKCHSPYILQENLHLDRECVFLFLMVALWWSQTYRGRRNFRRNRRKVRQLRYSTEAETQQFSEPFGLARSEKGPVNAPGGSIAQPPGLG